MEHIENILIYVKNIRLSAPSLISRILNVPINAREYNYYKATLYLFIYVMYMIITLTYKLILVRAHKLRLSYYLICQLYYKIINI